MNDSFELVSQRSIYLVKRNNACDCSAGIQNTNLASAEAFAASCVVDCLFFCQKDRLNAGSYKGFPAPLSPV
jgi:hypothetical protein